MSLFLCKSRYNNMEERVSSVNDAIHHNGEVEWQPLALTLVEYPKGVY